MTVQELASKMNEYYRTNMGKWEVRITLDGQVYHPIKDIMFRDFQVGQTILLSAIERKEEIPITKSDLERAQRATYEEKK